jgi:hypothetical protein
MYLIDVKPSGTTGAVPGAGDRWSSTSTPSSTAASVDLKNRARILGAVDEQAVFDQDAVSYAGNVREVAVNDLSVRRIDRDARLQSPFQGSSASTDYEIESPELDVT